MQPASRYAFSLRWRALLVSLGVLPMAVTVVVMACSGGSSAVIGPPRGGADGGGGSVPSAATDKSVSDASSAPDAPGHKYPSSSVLARGEYLVDNVAACGACHTPRNANGVYDRSKYLAGVECLLDDNGAQPGACLHSRNLTQLDGYSDDEIKAMFLDGKRPDGTYLNPWMPYWVFHNMTVGDADAIVGYLRTVKAVTHIVPPNDPPYDSVPFPAEPIPGGSIPPSNGTAAADRGRYLSSAVATCISCHTPELPPGSERPIDMAKPFSGNRPFKNIVVAGAPTTVYSANITSQLVAGIGGWTVDNIRKAIREGRDQSNSGICPPMPVGPAGPYGGMTEQDANDIATYLKIVPAINVRVTGTCSGP